MNRPTAGLAAFKALLLSFLMTAAPLGAATTTAVLSGNWSNISVWSNGVPGPGDTAEIPGFSVAVDGNLTVGNLVLTATPSGGVASGNGSLAITGNLLMGNDTTLGAAGGISLLGDSAFGGGGGVVSIYYNPINMPLDNFGTADVFASITEGSNPVTWTNHNGSTMILHGNTSLGSNTLSQVIVQPGANLAKAGSAGDDTATIHWGVTNHGTITVAEGILLLTGSHYAGAGDVVVAPGAALEFASTIFAPGTVVDAPVFLTGANHMSGNQTFTGGILVGGLTGNFALYGNLSMQPGSYINSEGTVELRGNVTTGSTTTSGSVSIYYNPTPMTLDNYGDVDVFTVPGEASGITEGGNTLFWNNKAGSNLTLNDSATLGSSPASQLNLEANSTLTKTGGNTSVIYWSVTNSGTIAIQSGTLKFEGMTWHVGAGNFSLSPGAALQFNSVTFDDGVDIDVPALLSGTTTVSGNLTTSGASLTGTMTGNFSLYGDLTMVPGTATLQSAGTVQLHGQLTAGSTTLSGSVSIYNNPTPMTVDNYGMVDVLTVPGEANGITEGGNALFWNNLAGSDLVLHDSATLGSSPNSQFHNQAGATLTKAGGNTSTIYWSVTNSGTIAIQSGALKFEGMTWHAANGTFLLGSGASLQFNSSTFDDNAEINVPVLISGPTTISGNLMTNGGVFTGTLNSPLGDPPGSGPRLHGNYTLDVNAHIAADGTQFHGTSDFGSNTTAGNVSIYTSGPIAVENHGTANVYSAGGGHYGIADGGNTVQWTNRAGSHTLLHGNASFVHSSSSQFTNEAGGNLTKTGGGVSHFNWGLTNNGSVVVHEGQFIVSGPFVNHALLEVREDGLFAHTGNATLLSTGTLVVEIGSTSEYGMLDVAGTLGLAGTLSIFLMDGYVPAAGDSFLLFNATSITGNFTTFNLPAIPGGGWNTSLLNVTGELIVVPEPAAYAALAGLLTLAAAVRRRRC